MITRKTLLQNMLAFSLCILATFAQAQTVAGTWDLTEPSGGAAIGKMVLSSDGAINFDGSIGSWSQSGSHITSTIYGSQKLRAAGIPIAELNLELSDNNTFLISMYNMVNKQTYKLGARRQGGLLPQANSETITRQAKSSTPSKASEPQTQDKARPVPQYTPQQVTIPAGSQTCPPGYSPARHSNGVVVAAAPGVYCVKDPQKIAVKVAHQRSGDSGANSTSNSATVDSNVDAANGKVPKKSAVKKTFRKIPNPPPRGSAPEGLAKANGSYKCAAINSYAHQYSKDIDQLFNERMSAPYRSDAKCQTRCDLLAWREEILETYHYHGSWDCSTSAVGLWNGADAGGHYSSYHDGKNDDNCTCVTSVDTPILFSAEPK
jgi:hypothetical protein